MVGVLWHPVTRDVKDFKVSPCSDFAFKLYFARVLGVQCQGKASSERQVGFQ